MSEFHSIPLSLDVTSREIDFFFLILGGPFQTLDRTTRQINKELQMGFYCSLAVTENST